MRAGRTGLGVVLAIARGIARAAGGGGVAAALAAMLVVGGCTRSHGRGEVEEDRDGDGYLATGGDCDDSRDDVHPGGDDSCGPPSCSGPSRLPDSVDQDCDGRVDEGCMIVTNCFDAGIWPPPDAGGYVDRDGDGHPEGSDCDDTNAQIHPGAEERCTETCEAPGRDDDCDGLVDEDCHIALNCFYDADGDGYGSGFGPGPDCNDADASIYPGAPEYCWDGVDRDCDGDASEEEEGCIIVNGVREAEDDGAEAG